MSHVQILPDREMLPSLLGEYDNNPRLAVLQLLAVRAPAGDVVEVGVYKGGSARVLEWAVAQRPDCKLWLYDTFCGIPYQDKARGDSCHVGMFGDGLSENEARRQFPDANVWQGVFPVGAPLPEHVAFAHLDADQYQSTREALIVLFPRMVDGGLIVLDDYGLRGCELACREAQAAGHNLIFLPDGRAAFQC